MTSSVRSRTLWSLAVLAGAFMAGTLVGSHHHWWDHHRTVPQAMTRAAVDSIIIDNIKLYDGESVVQARVLAKE